MATYVALLRAINLGSVNKISMPELKTMFEALGHKDVRTYVQSGNVVFDAARTTSKKLARQIEEAVSGNFRHDISVIIRTASQMERVATGNPFASQGVSPQALHAMFFAETVPKSAIKSIDPDKWFPDQFEIRGRDMYLFLPNGMGRARLSTGHFEKTLGVRGTARNWNTVNKLRELANAR